MKLTSSFRTSMGDSFHGITINNLSNGSVVAAIDLQVDAGKTDNPEGVTADGIQTFVSAGIVEVWGQNRSITAVLYNGVPLTANDTVCDVFKLLKTCNSTEECLVESATGVPFCGVQATEDSDNRDLIVGLAVGIPLCLLALLAIILVIYIRCRRRQPDPLPDDSVSDSFHSIFANRLAPKGSWGAARQGLYSPDSGSISLGSDSSQGHLVARSGHKGRSDFQDTAWFDRGQPFQEPSSSRDRPGQSHGAVPGNFSWEYMFTEEPFRSGFEIQRPHVSPSSYHPHRTHFKASIPDSNA